MLTEKIKSQFLSSPPFQYLEAKELELLITYSRVINFKAGDILIQQGKKGDRMFVIIEGNVLITAEILGTQLNNLALLGPKEFIGEASLLSGSRYTTTAIADGPLQCLIISSTYFNMLGVFFPDIKHKITKAIIETVCLRLQKKHHDIVTTIKKSDIASSFTVKNIIDSLITPTKISLDEAKIKSADLHHCGFLKNLTDEEFDYLITNAIFIKANRGCTLLKSGDKTIAYYFIINGAVQETMSDDNKRAKLAVLGPISFFGGITYINQNPSIVSYTTCEKVILMKFNESLLLQLQKNNLPLWYKIYDAIGQSFVLLEQSAEKIYIRLNGEIYNR